MTYRTRARELAPWVIAFRPRRFAPAALVGVAFCAFVAFLFLPLVERVGVRCDRAAAGGGACVVTDWSPLRTTKSTLALDDVRAAEVVPDPKAPSAVRFAFVTTSGEVVLDRIGSAWTSDERPAAAAINAFLDDPRAHEVEATVGFGGWPIVLPVAALLFTLAALGRRFVGRARVVVDPVGRAFTVHRRRWPFRERATTVSFDEVAGASLEWKDIHEGDRHVRVRLDLASGATLPLSDDYFPPQDGHLARMASDLMRVARGRTA